MTSLVTYEGARFALHAKAVEMIESRMYHGAAPRQAIAVPADFAHPVRWKGIVRGEGFVTLVPLDVQGAYDSSHERTYGDPPAGDATVEAARRLPDFQTMIRFSQAPFWKTTPVSSGTLVELMDLRYGTPDDPGFAAVSSVVSRVVSGAAH